MMPSFSRIAIIISSSSRHSFLSLPYHWIQNLNTTTTPLVFKLCNDLGKILVASWSGEVHGSLFENKKIDEIKLNYHFLKVNGFKDGEAVVIYQIPAPISCIKFIASVASAYDWESMALNVEYAESTILEQIRVIFFNQKIVLWLEGGLHVTLLPVQCVPNCDLCILQQTSELHIIPFVDGNNRSSNVHSHVEDNCNETRLNNKSKISLNNELQKNIALFYADFFCVKMPLIKYEMQAALKIIQFPSFITRVSEFKILGLHPSLLIISKYALKGSNLCNMDKFSISVEKIFGIRYVESKDKYSAVQARCSVIVWENYIRHCLSEESVEGTHSSLSTLLSKNNCIASDYTIMSLGLSAGDIIKICYLDLENINCKKCNIVAYVSGLKNTERDLLKCSLLNQIKDMCKVGDLWLSKYSMTNIELGQSKFQVLLKNSENVLECISLMSFPVLNIQVMENEENTLLNSMQSFVPKYKYIGDKAVFYSLTNHLARYFTNRCRTQLGFKSYLIEGESGTGKTSLVESLMNYFSISPYNINVLMVKLKSLKNKKNETVQKKLKTTVEKCFSCPSLLVLDDLDVLISLNDDNTVGSQLSFMVQNLFADLHEIRRKKTYLNLNFIKIAMIVTCKSQSGLHYLSNDIYFFEEIFNLSALSLENRIEAVNKLCINMLSQHYQAKDKFNDRSVADYSLRPSSFMKNTEGYLPSDLKNVVYLAYINSYQMSPPSKDSFVLQASTDSLKVEHMVSSDNIRKAVSDYIPHTIKSFSKMKKESVRVGGLHRVRQVLQETILWPAKYSHILNQVSIRLRSGILLYGPPGCGKTLLANAVGSEFEINFITVKGPELLSKYIGASEEAVRNVFEKAKKAQPCLLFFDEFESIATKRGHDNTGVTDRVVNQLLTQMDGIEELTGVFILAATSRPDLIDLALLRPGRIDKCLYCPLPNQNERAEILQILSENMEFDCSVDWKNISFLTELYSGADLQSLLASAQMNAVRDFMKRVSCNDSTENLENVYENREIYAKSSLKDILKKNKVKSILSEEKILITDKHINKSLRTVVPSVSANERTMYRKLHDMFSSNHKSISLSKQCVTLA